MKVFLKRPVTICMAILVIILLSFTTLSNMAVDLLPNINIPMIAVSTVYPGASAQSVEQDVTLTLETKLKTVAGVKSVSTNSMDNVSIVVLEFDYGTSTEKNFEAVSQKLNDISLPTNAAKPEVLKVNLSDKPVATYALTRNDGNMDLLSKSGHSLASSMSGINGVAKIEVKGDKKTNINISPKAGAELATLLIVEALQSGNLDIPLGTIFEDGTLVSIRNVSEATSISDLENLPITMPATVPGGLPMLVKLSAIADVSIVEKYESISKFNGKDAVLLEITKNLDGNASQVVLDSGKFLADNVDTIGGGSGALSYALVDDQSEFINESIGNVTSSLIIGGILALIILLMFLHNLRSSLIVAITMPISILCAIICLYLCGVTLNMVSLGGLAIGIGMLVDNSIVVLEAITKKRESGKTAYDSASLGTKSVAGSIIASTLTTISVFLPIMFTQGLTKQIFNDLSLSVIFSLTFSLLIALIVIPTLYCLFYGKEKLVAVQKDRAVVTTTTPQIASSAVVPCKNTPLAPHKKTGLMARVENTYEKVLPKVLSKKLIVCIISIVLFASSVLLVFSTGTEFLPTIDKGLIETTVHMPSGTPLSEISDKTKQFEDKIREQVGEIDSITSSVGANGIVATSSSGLIRIKLKENKANTNDVVEQIRELGKEIPGIVVGVNNIDGVVASVTSGMSGLAISIVGDDVAVLAEISGKIKTDLAKVEGIRDITDNLTEKTTEYSVIIDKNLCAENNINYSVIVSTLRTGISGLDSASIVIGGEKLDVNVKFNSGVIHSLESLENFVVGVKLTGELPSPILLKDVSSISTVQRNSVITKENGKNVLNISAQIHGVEMTVASKEFSKITATVLADYTGYTYSESGVQSYLSEAFVGLVMALFMSLFLLFAIMAAQFESLIKPLIVMFAIPFSFTGGFLALFITGTTLNVVSFIGIIMLVGVIVNNAIVMCDKIAELVADGVNHFDAVVQGAKERLRPIVMTTLTTILALVPLALGLGKGGELMQPMAIVVIGGLVVGTLVTLVIIPVIYCSFKRIKPLASIGGTTLTQAKMSQEQELSQERLQEKPQQMSSFPRIRGRLK